MARPDRPFAAWTERIGAPRLLERCLAAQRISEQDRAAATERDFQPFDGS